MKNKWMATLIALVLCISAFLLPMTVHAAAEKDTAPPKLTAELKDETLHLSASDEDSGVEAIYVDGNRVNSLANGKAEVALKDYAGNGKQVNVYAVDFSGNRSETVKIDNPYYKAPAPLAAPSEPQTPEQEPVPPTPTPVPEPATTSTPAPTSTTTTSASSSADNSSASTSSPKPQNSDTSNTDSSADVPVGANPFTPEGTGAVMDNATDEDGKEFYTITTEDGNIFHLVIDNQRADGNVYLLNAVTEDDLMALAEKNEVSDGWEVTPVPEPELETEPVEDEEPEAETENSGMLVFILVAAVVAIGAGYYVKVVKPRQQAQFNDEEDEFDEDDFEDENLEDYLDESDEDLEFESEKKDSDTSEPKTSDEPDFYMEEVEDEDDSPVDNEPL